MKNRRRPSFAAPCDRVTDHRTQFSLRWQDHLNTLRPHEATQPADGPRPQDPAGCLLLLGTFFIAANTLGLSLYLFFS